MNKIKKLITITLTLTCLMTSTSLIKAASKPAAPSYAARVGTSDISKEEFSFFVNDIERNINNYSQGMMANSMVKSKKITPAEYYKQIALNNAVDMKIQLIKAKEAKINLTKKETDDINKQIEQNLNSLAPTKQEQEKVLFQQTKLNVSQFKKLYLDYSLMNKFVSNAKKNYKFTDAELKQFYNENKDALNKATVGHILFMTIDANGQPLPADKHEAAKKNAEEVLAKVNAGGNFAELAKQYSEDPGSKNSGGTYTVSKNGQMVAEFESWAMDPGRKVGDTGIIKTTYGYHVMKLIKQFSFNDLVNDIKNSLAAKKYNNDLTAWKKDKKLKVTINKAVYDSISIQLPKNQADNTGINENPDPADDKDHPKVEILISNGGKMVFTLYPEYAPQTVANFIKLAKGGFYDGLKFHRIVKGFMIQGGDPKGDGTGGSKDTIKGEFSANGYSGNKLSHKRGVISMARTQDMNSASCQFFIMDADNTQLDGSYAAFGIISEGLDTLTAIANSPVVVNNLSGENSTPKTDIVIKSVKVIKE